jgi:hypothetical protein
MSIFNKEINKESVNRIEKSELTPQELKEAGTRFGNVIRAYQEHIGVIDDDILDMLRQKALKRVVTDRNTFRI